VALVQEGSPGGHGGPARPPRVESLHFYRSDRRLAHHPIAGAGADNFGRLSRPGARRIAHNPSLELARSRDRARGAVCCSRLGAAVRGPPPGGHHVRPWSPAGRCWAGSTDRPPVVRLLSSSAELSPRVSLLGSRRRGDAPEICTRRPRSRAPGGIAGSSRSPAAVVIGCRGCRARRHAPRVGPATRADTRPLTRGPVRPLSTGVSGRGLDCGRLATCRARTPSQGLDRVPALVRRARARRIAAQRPGRPPLVISSAAALGARPVMPPARRWHRARTGRLVDPALSEVDGRLTGTLGDIRRSLDRVAERCVALRARRGHGRGAALSPSPGSGRGRLSRRRRPACAADAAGSESPLRAAANQQAPHVPRGTRQRPSTSRAAPRRRADRERARWQRASRPAITGVARREPRRARDDPARGAPAALRRDPRARARRTSRAGPVERSAKRPRRATVAEPRRNRPSTRYGRR